MNEASWEELLKESIGGRSNTSAYSLVYIDTSKPEILLQITEDTTGEAQEDCMEDGKLEMQTYLKQKRIYLSLNSIIFQHSVEILLLLQI